MARENFPPAFTLRAHRLLSRLERAEQERGNDQEARLVFLWIAFNTAYATEIGDRRDFGARRQLLNFLNRLIDADRSAGRPIGCDSSAQSDTLAFESRAVRPLASMQ